MPMVVLEKNSGERSKEIAIFMQHPISKYKKESPSVETERPLTIACHMKKSYTLFLQARTFNLHTIQITF